MISGSLFNLEPESISRTGNVDYRLRNLQVHLLDLDGRLSRESQNTLLTKRHRDAALVVRQKLKELHPKIESTREEFLTPQPALPGWASGDEVPSFISIPISLFVGVIIAVLAAPRDPFGSVPGMVLFWYFLFLGGQFFWIFWRREKVRTESAKLATELFKKGFDQRVGSLEDELMSCETKMHQWVTEQSGLYSSATHSAETSVQSAVGAARNIVVAREQLDDARLQFERGALVSFWDSVEKAIEVLSKTSRQLEVSENSLRSHSSFANSYLGSDPINAAAASPETLKEIREAALSLSKEVKDLSYEAQFLPTFAQIYEMRRNTATLASGFSSMHDAIHGLGDRIENSLSEVNFTLASGFQSVVSAVDRVESAVFASAEAIVGSIDVSREAIVGRLDSIRSLAEESIQHAITESHYSRAALVESIKSDYEIRVMLAGVTKKISPQSLSHVRELYGTILDPGPRLPS